MVRPGLSRESEFRMIAQQKVQMTESRAQAVNTCPIAGSGISGTLSFHAHATEEELTQLSQYIAQSVPSLFAISWTTTALLWPALPLTVVLTLPSSATVWQANFSPSFRLSSLVVSGTSSTQSAVASTVNTSKPYHGHPFQRIHFCRPGSETGRTRSSNLAQGNGRSTGRNC